MMLSSSEVGGAGTNPTCLLIQRPATTVASSRKIRSHNLVPEMKELEVSGWDSFRPQTFTSKQGLSSLRWLYVTQVISQ